MSKGGLEIDLVYLWVDGDDPVWQAKKRTINDTFDPKSETNNKGRFSNNDELLYSLRSAEKYVPWIRKIFIITDNQKPKWLNTNHPKIQIIDHKDILPAESLPCFNSSVIECFVYKIPDLADRFLLANDDMFFNAALNPDFFFNNEDGFPIVRLKKRFLGRYNHPIKAQIKSFIGKKIGQYAYTVENSARLVHKRFGTYITGVPHHNIDSYLKEDFKYCMESLFRKEVEITQKNHIRSLEDLQRSVILYSAIALKRGHLKYVGRRESSRILVYRHSFLKYLEKYQPKLFCLNDNQRVTDDDRMKIEPFLATILPQKSTFEK